MSITVTETNIVTVESQPVHTVTLSNSAAAVPPSAGGAWEHVSTQTISSDVDAVAFSGFESGTVHRIWMYGVTANASKRLALTFNDTTGSYYSQSNTGYNNSSSAVERTNTNSGYMSYFTLNTGARMNMCITLTPSQNADGFIHAQIQHFSYVSAGLAISEINAVFKNVGAALSSLEVGTDDNLEGTGTTKLTAGTVIHERSTF